MAKQEPNFRPMGGSTNSAPADKTEFCSGEPHTRLTSVRGTVLRSDFLKIAPRQFPDQCFVVALASRPGVSGFFAELEMTLFPPSTMKNHDLQLINVDWHDTQWYVLYFPNRHREAAEAVAQKWCLHFREYGAIPMLFWSKNGVSHRARFPIHDSDNVYVVENTEDLAPLTWKITTGEEQRIRQRWANSVPLRQIDVVDADHQAYTDKFHCNVCIQDIQLGDTIALVGDDPMSGLGAFVHIEHIDRDRKVVPL